MGMLTSKPKPEDYERILEQYEGQIAELIAALIAGEPDVDLKLAAMLEGVPEQVRIAIVEKMRAMVNERHEEKSQKLEAFLHQQRTLLRQQKHQLMHNWLAYFMSQETLRKIRESFMAMPGLEHQVKNIGQDLAKTGVLQNIQHQQKQDLGAISTTIQNPNRQTGKDQGKGR